MNAFSTGTMADDLLRWAKQLESLGGAVISMATNEADDVSFDLYGESLGITITQYANAIHDAVEENYGNLKLETGKRRGLDESCESKV